VETVTQPVRVRIDGFLPGGDAVNEEVGLHLDQLLVLVPVLEGQSLNMSA